MGRRKYELKKGGKDGDERKTEEGRVRRGDEMREKIGRGREGKKVF